MLERLKHFVVNNTPSKKFVKNVSLDQAHDYWKTTTDQFNSPEAYLNASIESANLILSLIEKAGVTKNDKILDLGCNVGRTMNYLYNRGYRNLSGIDISTRAIDLMMKSYPDMAMNSTIYNESFEIFFKDTRALHFDCIFTCGVLMHVHKDSEWIFEKIVRLTDKLITFEDETGIAKKNFPRNYKTLFESLGMKQTHEIQSLNLTGRILENI